MEFRELLELYKNGKYEEVIKEAENINDFNAIFLLLRSYIALNRDFEAIDAYQKFRESLESHNLIESIKIYLYLLVRTGADKYKMQKEIDYFRDKNYVNQETEEFLCKLDEYVEEIKESEKTLEKYTVEEVIEMLKSNDEHIVFAALNEIIRDEKYRSINLMPTIAEILNEKAYMSITYGMLLDFLVTNRFDCSLLFKNNGHYFKINPSELADLSIEQAKLVNQALAQIQSNEKNISIGNYVIKIIIKATYFLAPRYISNITEMASFVCAIYQMACSTFKVNLSDDKVLDFYINLADKHYVEEYYNYIIKLNL